ncbi:MAG: DNA polymerase I, partial [Rhodospirillales bacterium]
KDDCPVPVPLEEMRVGPRDTGKLLAYLDLNGFRSIANRVRQGAGAAPASSPTATPAPAPGTAAAAPADTATAKDDYDLVQDLAALWKWIEGATAQGLVAIDTETTSLDAMRAELVGVSLALAPGKACYIPLGHLPPGGALGLDGPVPQQIPLEEALAALRPMLADRSVLKVGHNIKYDMEVLRRYDAPVTPFDDTMLMSYVLDAGLRGHGLDELAKEHLGRTNITYADVTGTGKSQIGFAEVPLAAALDYAAEDADVSLRLHALFKPRLLEQRLVTVYETLERPLVPVLLAMECAGIKVDANELRRLSQDFEGRIAQIAAEVHRLAGHPFNIGSPKQLGEVLFDEMSLPGGKKGKTGAYATGADVLEDLAAAGHDLPARVLDWRQLTKLKSTYTDALIGTINPATGRVHTSYAQAIASTGRLSSNEPNLQNIPIRTEEGRKIRKAFVADDGCVLLSADYSQIELRLLADVAGIETLKEAFRNGADIHAMTASEVFGVPVKGMDPAVRNRAKAINFGIVYGISAFGLARQLGIPQADAARFIKTYFEHYPGIRDYVETMRAFARAHGYVTTIFGRRVHMPGINDKNPTRRNFFERAAINAPLQGAAADIIKRAMVRMPDALKAKRLAAKMLLQVHDELVFEVPEAEAEETAAVVKKVMSGVAQLSVPLVVETGTAKNWADAHCGRTRRRA